MTAQVRSEYKLTEAGVIPDDWSCTLLATLATSVASGRSKPDAIYGEYPVYGSTGIIGNTNNASHAGDVILVARVGANAGKLNLVTGKFGVTDNTIIIRLKDNLCLPFFYSQLERKNLNSLVFGSGQPLITGTQLKALAIPMPELHEQRIIAAALSDMDALISGLDQLIAKKRDIKQATMQQFLTGQQRLPGFSEPWSCKRLADICYTYSGGTPSTSNNEYYSGNIPWITSGDLNKHCITEVSGRISERGLINSSAKIIDANTLLIALYGATAGVTAVSKIKAAINQAVLAIIPFWGDVTFLYFKLSYLKDWIISTYTQGGQPNLSGLIVKSIEILLPAMDEQIAIASILSDMDTELAALETRRDKALQLKQAMMQELLTGRIRFV